MFAMEEILGGPVTVPFKVRHKETNEERDIEITFKSTLVPDVQYVHVIATSNLSDDKYIHGELGNKVYRATPHDQWRSINSEFTHLADAVTKVTLGYKWRISGSPKVN